MGGNEWVTTGPYLDDLAEAFRRAQQGELAAEDYGFPGRTAAELWQDSDWVEYVFTGGTGSTLDFHEFSDREGDQDDGGRMRLLTDGEVRAWAPNGTPTHAEWRDALASRRLDFPRRACGNCTVLYRDGEPAEIGYWGCTAD